MKVATINLERVLSSIIVPLFKSYFHVITHDYLQSKMNETRNRKKSIRNIDLASTQLIAKSNFAGPTLTVPNDQLGVQKPTSPMTPCYDLDSIGDDILSGSVTLPNPLVIGVPGNGEKVTKTVEWDPNIDSVIDEHPVRARVDSQDDRTLQNGHQDILLTSQFSAITNPMIIKTVSSKGSDDTNQSKKKPAKAAASTTSKADKPKQPSVEQLPDLKSAQQAATSQKGGGSQKGKEKDKGGSSMVNYGKTKK